ncbi:hypothetical protein [Chryseobacterium indologenes]|uniref:Uncharacterized protein n=1 Tax=Chryseobacterium indologenes TaxID=253 RepID=A0A0N0ZU02_CHRID|nr:hypothetical protein [Chryseobacterium indologenes]KPE50738.1 hypothetical protein AOB46_13180 [Chryseobacterium indologenes]
MNPELKELFELKDEKEETGVPKTPEQNVVKHVLIRLSVLIAGTVGFGIAMHDEYGLGAVGYLLFMMAFHALWAIIMFIEALVLQSNKKLILRNTNFVLIAGLLFMYGLILGWFK